MGVQCVTKSFDLFVLFIFCFFIKINETLIQTSIDKAHLEAILKVWNAVLIVLVIDFLKNPLCLPLIVQNFKLVNRKLLNI